MEAAVRLLLSPRRVAEPLRSSVLGLGETELRCLCRLPADDDHPLVAKLCGHQLEHAVLLGGEGQQAGAGARPEALPQPRRRRRQRRGAGRHVVERAAQILGAHPSRQVAERPDAARFSFLLGVPAIAGAGIFEMKDAIRELGEGAWLPLGVATAVSMVSGYAAIAWLIRFLGRRTLTPFAVYRIALAGLLVVLAASGYVK